MNFLNPIMLVTAINPDLDMDTLFGGLIDLLLKLAFYGGGMLLLGGVITFLIARSEERTDSQNKAINAAIIGGVLIGLRFVLEGVGILVKS